MEAFLNVSDLHGPIRALIFFVKGPLRGIDHIANARSGLPGQSGDRLRDIGPELVCLLPQAWLGSECWSLEHRQFHIINTSRC